ncbi:MAG: DUF2892 domain-containing protein [Acholeplasma sp.]|nr:DUF2892 domain-containing protein [Acholeplasma sp.]
MKLNQNVGSMDKMIRYILALVFVITGALLIESILWLGIALFAMAAMMVLTALFSFCGLYKIFGINTCKIK